jgi:mevalonate kinase
MADRILEGALPSSARAPGVCTLFGGLEPGVPTPEASFALDLTGQIVVARGTEARMNGREPSGPLASLFFATVRQWGFDDRPLDVRWVSRIPRSAGLGTEEAFVAALSGCLGAARGGLDRAELAERTRAALIAAGVRTSFSRVAAVTEGGFALEEGSDVPSEGGGRTGSAGDHARPRRAEDPGWTWIVAYSGIPGIAPPPTRSPTTTEPPDPSRQVDDLGRVELQGVAALERGDRAGVASAMTEGQRLLEAVGGSHPRLDALLRAAGPASEGGRRAGSGGSVVVLPKPGAEIDAVRRIARAGGLAFAVRPDPDGLRSVEIPLRL